jgi:hypothetical protein
LDTPPNQKVNVLSDNIEVLKNYDAIKNYVAFATGGSILEDDSYQVIAKFMKEEESKDKLILQIIIIQRCHQKLPTIHLFFIMIPVTF